MSKLVYLVPLFPLIGFLINGLGRKSISKSLTGIIGSGVILASFIVSLVLFFDVKAGHAGVVKLFDFITVGKLDIPFAFQVDQLSSISRISTCLYSPCCYWCLALTTSSCSLVGKV